jgi:SGNH hydrolase-like domain, acetyltransferase AlgX
MVRRERVIGLAFAVVAAAFFVGPIALRAAGVKAHCCPENRPFAPTPKLADGWNVFDETTRYLVDRMPGRQRAVSANTWISRHVYASIPHYALNGAGQSTSDRALPFSGRPAQQGSGPAGPARPQAPKLIGDFAPVAPGRRGWMFLEHEFDRACHQFMPLPAALDQWLAFIRMIRASGRRVVLAVPADKSTIYPELVSPKTPELKCALRGKAALWAALQSARARRGGIVGLRNALRAAKASSKVLTYFPRDAHWNTVGALALPRAVVPALDRRIRVLPTEIVDTGPAPHTGDLTVLLGAPRQDIAPTRVIRRARGAAVVPGPSVLVGDSFSDLGDPVLAPYLANHKRVNWDDPPASVAQAIKGAKTVVLEVIEWQFDFYPTKYGALNPGFRQLVARTLGQG